MRFLKPAASSCHTQVVQEDAHRVHPHVLGPTQFFVDLRGVETLRLPHFEFVDCVFRNIVAADQPSLLVIPRFSSCPHSSGSVCACREPETEITTDAIRITGQLDTSSILKP